MMGAGGDPETDPDHFLLEQGRKAGRKNMPHLLLANEQICSDINAPFLSSCDHLGGAMKMYIRLVVALQLDYRGRG
jgi:hypothetical protein